MAKSRRELNSQLRPELFELFAGFVLDEDSGFLSSAMISSPNLAAECGTQ